ncbi:MAG: hypothetical protein FWF23_05210 [Alphaproteobacteria bacterium]|nr:hypothetical protein [Alphaproteobacteria bacterium]MCL2505363.1 hypothetical protein [Alphaproteobacteria bacterium]
MLLYNVMLPLEFPLVTKVIRDNPAALHEALFPPCIPWHDHTQLVPLKLSVVLVPTLQRAVVKSPHTPFIALLAEQEAGSPPLIPSHSQVHGPSPLVAGVLPSAHRFVVGADANPCPCALPHTPFAILGRSRL